MSGVGEGPREVVIKTARVDPDSVSVTVQDSGPGLDPAHAEHTFEAFYTTKPEGLGIGLSICRSIVEAHGGEIAVTANVHPTAPSFNLRCPRGTERPNSALPGRVAGKLSHPVDSCQVRCHRSAR
ncbi:MAG TPA: ATP-binding protein [Candidatus Binatia bacterium]|nr:ATP-binding protein [Candidatus Binatia bacterium]